MRIRIMGMFLVLAIQLGSLAPACGQGISRVPAPGAGEEDTLLTKEGQTLAGKITSMDEGKVRVETTNGAKEVAVEDVQRFRIQSKSQSAVDERALRTLIANQEEMASRIELLVQAIASLERQLMNIQANQSIQSRRLTERTTEVNPIAKVVVLNHNTVRRDGNTYVVGQVSNQSETVVSGIQVQVTVYGRTGKLSTLGGQATKVGYTTPSTIAPGQTAAFEVGFEGLLIIRNTTVQVAGYPPQGGAGSLPFRINGPYRGF